MKGLEIAKLYNKRNLEPYYNTTIGEVYVKLGRIKEAKPYFKKVLLLKDEVKDPSYNPLILANFHMADIRYNEGRYREAFDHLEIANELERDLLKLENEKLIELYEKELESIEKDKTLSKLTYEKEQQALKLRERGCNLNSV